MISNTNKKIPDVLPYLYLNNSKLSQQKQTKFLGITINDKLSWSRNITAVNRKMQKHCGISNLVNSCLISKSLELMPYCAGRSFTEYVATSVNNTKEIDTNHKESQEE